MSDSTTKIILHVNDETGKVEKAEHEDSAGNRTEVTGNFSDVTVKNEPTKAAQMNYRMVPEPAPSEEDDDNAATQTSADAPSV